ncbi:hypothetical protein [Legionella nagasakiensis]|uniref:hypothetical protein n=1 Tax=Legionella nagasakiensis TaxID=535290 RepID=UPI0010561AEF|nr:hypothetical protein [Legionella nagasakiensis]
MLTIIFTVITMYVVFNYILKPMVGYLTPLEKSGRLCLQEQLRTYGINPNMLPRACLDDFVSSDIQYAEFSSKQKGVLIHSELISFLDMRAELIARLLFKPSSETITIESNFIAQETLEILQKYRLIAY